MSWQPQGRVPTGPGEVGLQPLSHSGLGGQPPWGHSLMPPPGSLEPAAAGQGLPAAGGSGPLSRRPWESGLRNARLPETSGPASCAAGSCCALSPQRSTTFHSRSGFPGPGHVVQVSAALGGWQDARDRPGWAWGCHTSWEWRTLTGDSVSTLRAGRPQAVRRPPAARGPTHPSIHRPSPLRIQPRGAQGPEFAGLAQPPAM